MKWHIGEHKRKRERAMRRRIILYSPSIFIVCWTYRVWQRNQTRIYIVRICVYNIYIRIYILFDSRLAPQQFPYTSEYFVMLPLFSIRSDHPNSNFSVPSISVRMKTSILFLLRTYIVIIFIISFADTLKKKKKRKKKQSSYATQY